MLDKKIIIKRWSSERALFLLAVLFSLTIWIALVISIIGAFIVVLLMLSGLLAHLASIAHIKGNGIKVTTEQYPELYESVLTLSKRIGLKKVPEVYILQGHGMLNALATKFLYTKIFVIYSNLIDACEDKDHLYNMIIGHELGHIRAGHLRWNWFIWPGKLIPFLGNALSRAREYTADRYGAACVNSQHEAISGLILLASGKNLSNKICMRNVALQIKDMNTGYMRIGEWLHTHPTLARRICALDPTLNKDTRLNSTISVIKGLFKLMFITVTFALFFIILMYSSPTPSYLKEKAINSISSAK